MVQIFIEELKRERAKRLFETYISSLYTYRQWHLLEYFLNSLYQQLHEK
jgi:hypothetical protein